MAIAFTRNRNSYFSRLTTLKKLFWLYFILLIFEGALRKWVAPQLSAPLLIIRDPVGLWIIWEAYRTRKFPSRWTTATAFLTVALVGLFLIQIVAGDNSWIVGLYGLRSYLLPFPVLFIMGENLDEEDIRKFGTFILLILPFEAVLEVGQYVSPGSSFLNRGAYSGGAQIAFAGEHVRASGTFSFTVGAEGMAALAAAFFFYGMATEGFAKKSLLWVGAFATVISIPMAGSRGVVYQLIAMVGCMTLAAFFGVSQFGKVLRVIIPVMLIGFLASQLPVFSDATTNLASRFASKGLEGGGPVNALISRTVTPIIDRLQAADLGSDWMGAGLGRGAIAMDALINGTTGAVLGEDEFSREMAEMGPFGGLLFSLFKVFVAAVLIGKAIAKARDHEPLALLLAPSALSALMFSTPEQTTEQGFMVMGLAFMIAACKSPIYQPQTQSLHPLLIRRNGLRRQY